MSSSIKTGQYRISLKRIAARYYLPLPSEYAEFDTESEMNDYIEKNSLEVQEWVLHPEMAVPEESDLPEEDIFPEVEEVIDA